MHRPGPGMCVRDAEEETPRLYAARLRRKNRLAAAATTPRRAPVFDCLILEPCQPGLDPTFLIDGLGGRAIAAAVNRLADWTRSRRTSCHLLLSTKQLHEGIVLFFSELLHTPELSGHEISLPWVHLLG